MEIGSFTSLLDDSFIFERLTEKDYPEFVTKTIRILGANSGLRLIFANKITESSFDPKNKIVRIPPPPIFPSNKKEKKAFFRKLSEWRGVLNHEVGHARFTLWRAQHKDEYKKQRYNKKYHTFVDLFENGRMERVVCKEYPGMIPDLQKLEGVLAKAIIKQYNQNPKEFNHLYCAMRMAVNGYEPVVEIPKELNKDFKKCMEFVEKAKKTNSEEETVKIAKKVYEFFLKRKKEEEKKEEWMDSIPNPSNNENKDEENNNKDEENNNSKGNEKEDKSNGKKNEEENKNEGKNNNKRNEEGNEEEDKSNDKKNEEENKNKERKSNGKENKKEGNKNNKENEEDNDNSEKISNENPGKEHFDIKTIEIIDPTKSVAKEIKAIRKALKFKRERDVIPMPLDDYVDNINIIPEKIEKETNEILKKTIGSICGMAQRFIQKVRSSQHVGSRTYQGRLNRRSLHKYKTSKNIFKTENLRKKKGASVMIVLDCSGSMYGNKMQKALQAALVTGEIMNQAKVEFEVVGFTNNRKSADFGAFTRTSFLEHYRFGSNKNWSSRKYGIINAEKHLKMADNDDGESLRQFASEIAKSKKERKMMIVISDGEPASAAQLGNTTKDLHTAIKEIRKNGIEIYSVGLNMEVERFYGKENSVNISAHCSTEDLVLAISKFIGLIANG